MGELIDFIVVSIFIYYLVRTVFRLIMPSLLQNVVNKAQQQQQNANNRQQYYNNTSAGQVKVDHIPDSHKGSIPDSEGEFVDYEEIK